MGWVGSLYQKTAAHDSDTSFFAPWSLTLEFTDSSVETFEMVNPNESLNQRETLYHRHICKVHSFMVT